MPSRRANGADHDEPFGQHDYEIIYGQAAGRLNRSAEVNVRAKRARPLNVGDVFTFGRDDGLWDAVVAEVTLGAGGAWNARCRMMEA